MTPESFDLEIARLVEYGEAEAYADMFEAAPPSLGMQSDRIGDAIALRATKLPIMLFNRVIGLGLLEAATEETLEQLRALYRGSPVYAVQIGPESKPENHGSWLEARDVRSKDRWAKVYRPATADINVPSDLRVEQIGPEHASAFAATVCEAFSMPLAMSPWLEALVSRQNWHAYAALEANAIVAVGMSFVHEGVAWLGLGGTLPSHRRRGAQGAIMARRIREAHMQGCEWVITETSEDLPERPNPSFHNMIRTGFRLAYQRRNHIFQATPAR